MNFGVNKDLTPGISLGRIWFPENSFRCLERSGGKTTPIPNPRTFTGLFQSKAQKVFLDGKRDLTEVDLSLAFSRFARRAFRRPVTQAEIKPYLQIEKDARLKLGRKPEEAFLIALKAILVSPDFLYLKEESNQANKLSSFEIANRLSHFFWSSLPDLELFNQAKENALNDPDKINQQAERLLRDPRSRSFVHGFSESWLRLDKLGTMPPASQKYQEYYRYGLENAMLEETHHFLEYAIKHNVSLTDFIQSDYGFLNQDLARHYGIKGVEGIEIRKVSFPENSMRGGLLGQGSILTLTANGVDTSPVTVGYGFSKASSELHPHHLPDVEPIDPDVRGAQTVKELLDKHRSVQACADCHAKIDPYGFPLEYFDPVGGYRPTYYKNRFGRKSLQTTVSFPAKPVDGSSILSSGEKIYGPRTLRKILLTKTDLLARNLASKLLIYGTGRDLTLQDKNEAKEIAEKVNKENLGFQDLILMIASSKAFSRK